MTDVERIKRAFLDRQGWIYRSYYGWSAPQRPLAWVPLAEAYDLASSVYRHWTSFKTRRASPTKGVAGKP